MRKIVLKLKSRLANTELLLIPALTCTRFVRFVSPKDTAEESMFLCACTSGFSLAKGTGTERTGNKFLLLFYATKDMHNGRMFFINVENE